LGWRIARWALLFAWLAFILLALSTLFFYKEIDHAIR
jgi:hypothetical protein